MELTTIQVDKDTVEVLKEKKLCPRESYRDVLNRILKKWNGDLMAYKNPELTLPKNVKVVDKGKTENKVQN